MRIIAGTASTQLASSLANSLGISQVAVEVNSFANHEQQIRVTDSVVGETICIVQSFIHTPDTHIMQLLLLADALERMGAGRIFAVIPWMGYSLQDKVFQTGQPISAKVVASLISHSPIERVLLADLHNASIPGFFSIPTTYTTAQQVFEGYIRKQFELDSACIVSPDFGGLKRSRALAKALQLPLVHIDKTRDPLTGQVQTLALNSAREVQGKVAILFDDCIVSGGTAAACAQLLKQTGASKVVFCATHGIFANNAIVTLSKSQLDSIIITNSIEFSQQLPKQFSQLDLAPELIETGFFAL